MNAIRLQPDGRITVSGKPFEGEPLRILGHRVSPDPDYTLRSFFQMMERFPVYLNLNDFFPTLLSDFRKAPAEGCTYDGIDFLELSKTVEMIGFPEKRLEIYNALKGVQGTESFEIRSINMVDLLDMPLRLGRLKHVVFGDEVDVFEFDTIYTLFEFMEGIAWELSFHGTPTQCDMRR